MRVIRLLVHKIVVIPDGFEIHFNVGETYIKKFNLHYGLSSSLSESFKSNITASFRENPIDALQFFKRNDSITCQNGGPEHSISEHHHPHDFIELSPRTQSRIYEKCAPLYEKGLSIRDIEERTGIPKSTVRETLTKSGMSLRNPHNGNSLHTNRLHTKRGGHTHYGYAYLDGQLLIDPKEQIIVRKILKLHQSGMSGNAIAKELNNQKILSRSGKAWLSCVVRKIIKQNKSNPTNRSKKCVVFTYFLPL